jgi:hypothetical protein
VIVDDRDRPFLVASERESSFGVSDIHGSITVDSPAGSRVELGAKPSDIDLKITYTAKPPDEKPTR